MTDLRLCAVDMKDKSVVLNEVLTILEEYIMNAESRVVLYEKHVGLNDIFDFFNKPDASEYRLPSEDHQYEKGADIIAWDCYEHEMLGVVLGGKAKMVVTDIDVGGSDLKHCRLHGVTSKGVVYKVSPCTHVILLKVSETLNRATLNSVLEYLDALSSAPST